MDPIFLTSISNLEPTASRTPFLSVEGLQLEAVLCFIVHHELVVDKVEAVGRGLVRAGHDVLDCTPGTGSTQHRTAATPADRPTLYNHQIRQLQLESKLSSGNERQVVIGSSKAT
jgi:hypothetical protein